MNKFYVKLGIRLWTKAMKSNLDMDLPQHVCVPNALLRTQQHFVEICEIVLAGLNR